MPLCLYVNVFMYMHVCACAHTVVCVCAYVRAHEHRSCTHWGEAEIPRGRLNVVLMNNDRWGEKEVEPNDQQGSTQRAWLNIQMLPPQQTSSSVHR